MVILRGLLKIWSHLLLFSFNDSFYFQTFVLERTQPSLSDLTLPADVTVMEALDRVLRLPSVASKRYLTNKVSCVSIRPANLCFT